MGKHFEEGDRVAKKQRQETLERGFKDGQETETGKHIESVRMRKVKQENSGKKCNGARNRAQTTYVTTGGEVRINQRQCN